MRIFHYAFKIKDIASTRSFYIDLIRCAEGRSTDTWIDFNFFGHQLSAHVSDNIPELDYCGKVDGVQVPIPHFGVIVSMQKFKELKERLISNEITFIVAPQVRYDGLPGEQATMFFSDYSGNAIEVKAFRNTEMIFAE